MKVYLPKSTALVLLLLLAKSLSAALSGGYTIGAGPATATNYLTFTAAVSDLSTGVRPDGGPVNGPGVSGAVVFTVAAGTYNERITIPAITGASAVNTITFDGVDPLTRVITFNSTTSGDRTILLNGADYIRLTNLGIENTGVTYGFGVQLLSSADNNIISGCRVLMPTTATGTGKVAIIAGTTYTGTGTFANNLTVQNSTILGGYISLVANGQSTALGTGLVVTGNTMTDAYYSGFYIQYHSLSQVSTNVITMRTGNTSSYGGQFRYCASYEFSRNRIANPGTYGLYLISTNTNTTTPAVIVNNMIGGAFQTTATAYGIYLTTNRFVHIYHNSVFIDNPSSTGARCVYVLGTTVDLDMRNNALATTTPGASSYAMYVTTASMMQWCDYNAYYSAGTNLAYFQANYATLAAMQAAFVAYNQNCQAVYPNYISNTNLHSYGGNLNNWAFNLPSVTVDYDNETRPLPTDIVKDVGADEFVIPAIDPDIWQFVNPVVPNVGPNNIQVMLQNNGSSSLNGVPITMQYSIDGGTTWPVTQTFTPTTLGTTGSQETFTFATPWVIASSGTYSYCVRINPALVGDPDPTDQVCRTACTGMAGAYTVNSALATGGTNFNNFTDLATALSGCGVSAPVTVDIEPGLYVETFTIGPINGTSAVNTVTIDGGDTSLVTIAYNHTTINSSVITLSGSDHLTFKNIKVNSAGSNYGSCIKLTNTADYVTIDSCVMMMPFVSTSVYHIGVLASGSTYSTYGNNANFLTVKNSRIRGGYQGVRILGTNTSTYCNSNRVLNSKISEFYYYGIYSYYQNTPEFRDNTIIGRGSGVVSTTGYGLYSYYAQGNFRIEGNTVNTVGTYGMYLGYGNHNNSGKGSIINNMIGANFQTTATAYGIYMLNHRDVDFYHNSISLNYGTGYAIYVTGSPPNSDSLRFVNNIFSGGGPYPGIGGRAFYIITPSAVQSMNYNLYYSQGPQVIYWGGTTYNSLAAFQTGVPAFNANSVFDDPGFVSATNLHLICSPTDNLGTPLGITMDIDEQVRSVTIPDIGADEFASITVSTSLGPDITVCDRTTLYADTVNFETFLWGGGQFNPALNVDTTGQYTLYVIDSNNCRARDTIFVTVDSLPLLPYDNDTLAVCDNATLDALNQGSTYQWSNGPTTQTNTPGASGVYFVTITTSAGCALTDTVTLDLYPNPTLELGNDTTFCLGAGSILDAGAGPTGTTYLWSSGATSQVLVISSPGMYRVTVTSAQGCESMDSVFLNILLSPVVNLGANFTACEPFTLDAQNPGNTYVWSTGATSQTITASTAGNYAVTVTNAQGCSSSDGVTVTMGVAPLVSLGPDVVLCDGQNVTLDAGNTGSTHSWSTGATTQSITVSSAGTYIVHVTSPSSGCVTSDTILVIQSFLTLNLGSDFTLCPGDIATLDAGAAPTTYTWSTGANSQTIQVSTPGTYAVTVSDNLGCVLNDLITLTAGTAPTAAFTTSATSIPLFQSIQFTDGSTGATAWEWDFGDGMTSTQQNPNYTYLAIGTFNACLTATNGNCTNTICQTITVGPPVEVEDELFANAINLYPNPSTGIFSLDFDLTKSVDLGIDVLSMAGQRLLHRDLKAVRYQHESFDLQDLSSGVYILKVTSTKGDVWLRKLVIE